MRVSSPLADIDFHVGRVRRDGGTLVIESRDDSSLPAAVTVNGDDARQVLRVFLGAPGVLLFALSLLWRSGGAASGDPAEVWRRRRQAVGINKPW